MYIVEYCVNYGDISGTRRIINAYEVDNFKVPDGFTPTEACNMWRKRDCYGNTTCIVGFDNLVEFARFCTILDYVKDCRIL